MSDDHKKVNNHLIIGLGGTGGKIIREVRKTIASDPAPGSEVNFEYLYVDTSAELMKPDDPTWKVLGRSTQLAQSQQLLIRGADLGELLVNWGNPGTGDFNNDGTVSGADLGELLVHWGPCP